MPASRVWVREAAIVFVAELGAAEAARLINLLRGLTGSNSSVTETLMRLAAEVDGYRPGRGQTPPPCVKR